MPPSGSGNNTKIDDEVSDPTDWEPTTLPFVAPLDAALRCEICKDFYTAPVITNCCHTFCSLCIRRSLHADPACPICRAQEQEYRLRKNTTVQELVDAFVGCRGRLFQIATKIPEATVVERREVEEEVVEEAVEEELALPENPHRRRRTRQGRSAGSVASSQIVELIDEESPEPKIDGLLSSPLDGLVACPICSKRMRELEMNRHLDRCLKDQDTANAVPAAPEPRLTRSRSSRSQLQSGSSSAPPRKIEPLPKLTYSFYNDRTLRAKLKDLGIPDHGSKKLMQERHTEWVSIWNANADSKYPRPKPELLRALDTWERAHTRPQNNKTKATTWSDESWLDINRDSYSSLVQQAKENAKRRKVEVEKEEGPHRTKLPVSRTGPPEGDLISREGLVDLTVQEEILQPAVVRPSNTDDQSEPIQETISPKTWSSPLLRIPVSLPLPPQDHSSLAPASSSSVASFTGRIATVDQPLTPGKRKFSNIEDPQLPGPVL